MTNLARRLGAIEQRLGSGSDSVTAILRTLVEPGTHGPVPLEPRAIASLAGGWRIEREPGEGADAFARRAMGAAPRTPRGIARLLEVVA